MSSGDATQLAYLALGIATGLASGLLPGLHSNTVIAVIASLGLDPNTVALLIIALYPAHMVSSFIPAVFFGIPESGTVIAVLPGQRMVLEGKGLLALRTILLACIFAALISAALFTLSLGIYPLIYGLIKPWVGYILAGLVVILLVRSKNPFLATLVFAAAGILGIFALNKQMELVDPFLPLFSGLFAMAAILNYKKGNIPQQSDQPGQDGYAGDNKLRLLAVIVPFILAGVLLGMFADLLPGVGSPAQMATLATIALRMDTPAYLATISAISVSQAIFSLSTEASIDKSRVGATAWLAKSIDVGGNLPLLLVVFLLSMAVSASIVYAMRSKIARLASLDFGLMNIILAFYLVAVTVVLDGFWGLVVLALATALGWVTVRLGVERTNLMASILVPTLLLLFRIFI